MGGKASVGGSAWLGASSTSPSPHPASKQVTPQVTLRPSLRQGLPLTSLKPSYCPQRFDMLYRMLQGLLPKAKMP